MKKLATPPARSKAEAQLELQIRVLKLPKPVDEYRFHGKRRWRFDFAWPDLMLAVEVEGITANFGRHQRMQGYENDLQKYHAALEDGWTVYRCSPAMVSSGAAVDLIKKLIERLEK